MTMIQAVEFDPDFGNLTLILDDGTVISVKARVVGELPPTSKVTENDD